MHLNFKEIGKENAANGTLLIIHGLFGMLDNLMTIGRRFAETYQVYLLDLRNHGRSEWDSEHSYEEMASDLHQFIKKQQLGKPLYLLGHSMGGKAVMQFAANYPDTFDKLIVIDIAPKAYPVHHGAILDTLNSIDLEQMTNRNEAEQTMANNGLDIGTRQFLLKNLYRTDDGKFAWRMNLEVLTAKIDKIGEALLYRKAIKQPTLFVKGGKSQYIHHSDQEEIKTIFPHSQLVTIAGAGHWVHAEKPDELYEQVMNFLSQVR
ncbi:MAG: alpha/beta fold hydrolase [Cytophagales bacterium]|nr:MAG: alpha/beta fold hydrolase [Cytophagales bacterium]